MRRRFRFDMKLGKLVEIPVDPDELSFPTIHGELVPFVSVVDGSYIDSRTKLHEHMAKYNLVHYDEAKTQKREEDRYKEARDDKAMRECLWEGLSRTFSMGNRPRR